MIAALCVVGILLLLLLLPIKVRLKYDGVFQLWAGYGAGFVKIIPAKHKEKHKKPQKKAKEKKAGKPRKKPKKRITAGDIPELVKTVVLALKRLIRALRITRFRMYLIVSGPDAAAAAVNYGRACTAASVICPVLEDSRHISGIDISVDLRYDGKTEADLDIIIKAMLCKILALGIAAGFSVLKILYAHNKKGGKKNEQHQ